MLGEKILAVIFAALVLIKLVLLLIMPQQWLGMAQTFLGYSAALTAFYLIALIITGYFVFTTMNLVDVAAVMLFTGLLVGLSLVPYAASLLPVVQQVAAAGLGRAWLSWFIWIAIALAVLYRVFARQEEQ